MTHNITRAAKITRRDGQQIRIIELDVDATIDSELYTSIPLSFSDSESTESLSPDNSELTAFYDQLGIMPEETKRGLFAGASLELITYDFVNDTVIKREHYQIGEIEASDVSANIELNQSSSVALNAKITSVVTKDCRHSFGDNNCTVDKSLHKYSGTFTTGATLTDTGSGKVDGYYDSGELLITSGDNLGIKVDIVSFSSDQFFILGEFPYVVADGASYDVWRGCSGSATECTGYSNFINYGGFLHVPSEDKLLAGG